MMRPALILTPHSSSAVPPGILRTMLGDRAEDEEARARLIERLHEEGDPYTDEIFHVSDVWLLPAPVSRFVVDLNRYRSDRSLNGVVKLVDFAGRSLYPPAIALSEQDREDRLRSYWDPYHQEVARLLDTKGIRLVIAGHSMSPYGPKVGIDHGRIRPALTLMTGGDEEGEPVSGRRTSVAPAHARLLKGFLESCFADILATQSRVPPCVAMNRPWSEDEISLIYSDPQRSRPVPSFGLEINRALFHEHPDGTGKPIPDRIEALNAAFAAFLKEALVLLDFPSGEAVT